MAKSTLTHGKAAFLDYYTRLLPQYSDAEKLKSFLTRKNPPVLLVSPFHESELQALWHKAKLTWSPLPWFPYVVLWPPEVHLRDKLPGFDQGWLYSLNPASLLPALALNPQPADSILDASAAPGGKTLALANLLYPHPPGLIANDVSLPRFKRLRTVLKNFGYPHIITTRHSIQSLPYHFTTHYFTKILLDAPCSSEKHVFNSKQHLKIWSEKRIATLCHLQGLLIDSLVPLLAPEGSLIYSTCAINPHENEGVISSALKKHPGVIQLSPRLPSEALAKDGDPMFIALLKKSKNPS